MVYFDRLNAGPVYNTRAVAQRTGVPADTFRAWERRYGLPAPTRTQGNHRLYSEQDIAIVSWLRDRTREGITISQAVELFRQDRQREALAPSSSTPLPNGAPPGHHHSTLARFVPSVSEALIAFDASEAERIVEEALALAGVEAVCLEVLQPVLHDIGDRWASGEVGISAEHYASHFVLRKIGSLFNLSRPDEGRGPLVAACLEGEMHEVGLLLTSLFLSRRGYSVIYLGANLPLEDLLVTVRRVDPAMVLLSTSTDLGARRLARASQRLTEIRGCSGLDTTRPLIGFGGGVYVIHPQLRSEVDGIFLGPNAAATVEAVDRALSGPAAPPRE
ncbi:MAG: MerR family transcriptional regulator [Thermomicrobiales bacterium]